MAKNKIRNVINGVIIASFLVVNIAIAAPAKALPKTDSICAGDGGFIPCCIACLFLCECTLEDSDLP